MSSLSQTFISSVAHRLVGPISSPGAGNVVPGHTTLKRMLCLPFSRASDLDSAIMPALQAP
jgi:hypothetical protein